MADQFPPLQQKPLFDLVRKRLGLRNYFDFLRTIKGFLAAPEGPRVDRRKSTARSILDNYVTVLVRFHFTDQEKASKNQRKNLCEVLKTTDFRSKFVKDEISTFLKEAHPRSSYLDTENLDDGNVPPTYTATGEIEREVLNKRYIMPVKFLQPTSRKYMGKEAKVNQKHDITIGKVEDDLYDAYVMASRSKALGFKLEIVLMEHEEEMQDREERRKGTQRDTDVNIALVSLNEKDALYFHSVANEYRSAGDPATVTVPGPIEFSQVELAVLKDLFAYEKRDQNGKRCIDEKAKKVATDLKQLLKTDPVRAAKEILPPLTKRHQTLVAQLKERSKVANDTKRDILLPSLKRNSETIKHKEYPLLKPDILLNEITYPSKDQEVLESCFLNKNDDIGSQTTFGEGGLLMQFEISKWHKVACEILCSGGTAVLRRKAGMFTALMPKFFDLEFSDEESRRVQKGNVIGLQLHGGLNMYIAMRFYHMLLVRLYTAFLLADVDAKEYALLENKNRVGKKRRTRQEDDFAILMREKMRPLDFPPFKGTAEEKMSEFLEVIRKKETAAACRISDFESGIMHAIGLQGNQLFTMPTILKRLREAISGIETWEFKGFETYCDQKEGNVDEAKKVYQDEAMRLHTGWLFTFQCMYRDSYESDAWGSIGEPGDVGRVRATIVKIGSEPVEKNTRGKRALGSPRGRAARAPKKRKL